MLLENVTDSEYYRLYIVEIEEREDEYYIPVSIRVLQLVVRK